MGRDRQHLAARADAELRARRDLLRRLDELLDDAAHARELARSSSRASPRAPRTRCARSASRTAPRRSGLRIAEDGVALAREAVVELDDGAPQTRAAAPRSSTSASSTSCLAVEVLEPLRQGDAGLAEHLAAARLGAEVGEVGIDAVERDAEQDGELALERRRVEDGQVGARAVLDPLADALDAGAAARGSSRSASAARRRRRRAASGARGRGSRGCRRGAGSSSRGSSGAPAAR